MSYLTARLKQTTDKTTYALSAFHETQAEANVQYWNMVANDINGADVTEFTDFVIDDCGNIGKLRYYSRTEEELARFYRINIETYTEGSGKEPVKQIFEHTDRDSAEVAYCRDNASAETDDTILTAVHMVVNHHGGRELFEFYDNRPLPEPEPEPEEVTEE